MKNYELYATENSAIDDAECFDTDSEIYGPGVERILGPVIVVGVLLWTLIIGLFI